MRYDEAYRYGGKRLEEAGISEAKLDAGLLLEYVCGTDRNTLLAHPEREVESEEEKSYVNCIEKREKRIPLQHITGTQNFMGLDFYVNQNVLIPRQDTEILVEEVMLHLHDGMSILDLCTGSGCILISLLQYSNDCAGVGTDFSGEALKLAVKNAESILEQKGIKVLTENAVPVNNEVHFVCGDLFAPLDEAAAETEIKFDILVSNPPYIPTEVISTLEPEVAAHEPFMALDGREDGLFFYRKIIAGAGKYLNRGGKLFFEIGYDQGEAVSRLLEEAGFVDIEIKKDYAGLNRVVFGTFLED
ncbi:MAG: peptide chain release factor N(5)-glutamine methyltransferase [Lachnospiraceae bacterium]|nr:peptide chain release factor N(5)-glutamine methyltransferase [Lachnospiraceae bacterium]